MSKSYKSKIKKDKKNKGSHHDSRKYIPQFLERPYPCEKHVKVYYVKPCMSDEEIKGKLGEFFDTDKDYIILDKDSDVYIKHPNNRISLLARFRKKAIPEELTQLGYINYKDAAKTSYNLGHTAGIIDQNRFNGKKIVIPSKNSVRGFMVKSDGTVSETSISNPSNSGIVGNMDKTARYPCRQTAFGRYNPGKYKTGLRFIEHIDKLFQRYVPDKYAKQLNAIRKVSKYQVGGGRKTAFSTFTVNKNFRTALHTDRGDYLPGIGNMSVIEYGKYKGGYTIFPQYKVGVDIRSGDYFASDVHQYHCNTPIVSLDKEKDYARISFICYFRTKLNQCEKFRFNCKCGERFKHLPQLVSHVNNSSFLSPQCKKQIPWVRHLRTALEPVNNLNNNLRKSKTLLKKQKISRQKVSKRK